ncbi:hypothetical protein QCD58_002134 [Enterobacter hormaechei]|nr:hypothetical protein [Enterobacter hormaechei]
MRAKAFNLHYAVGSRFVFRSDAIVRGARVTKTVKTIGVARDLKSATVVEINVEPYFANINSLTPAGLI